MSKNTKKNSSVDSNNQKLLKKRKKEEDKELKEAIKETNRNIKNRQKQRRELGKKINFAPMEELIPIKKAIDRGETGFEYQNKLGFFDIVRIVSFDFEAMDDEELAQHIYHWGRFYLITPNPLKRLSLNMPVDTSQKIKYYTELLERTDNPIKRETIIKMINELKTSFEGRETRDYFLVYYADDLDSLRNEAAQISASLEDKGYAVKLTPLTKLQVLNKLCNPYTNKDMLTENFT